MEHVEGWETGDGGGLHTFHRKDQFLQIRATGDTSWHIIKTNPDGATGIGSAK